MFDDCPMIAHSLAFRIQESIAVLIGTNVQNVTWLLQ